LVTSRDALNADARSDFLPLAITEFCHSNVKCPEICGKSSTYMLSHEKLLLSEPQ